MPITPAKLALRRKTLDFDYGGDACHIEYYPSAVGGDTGHEVQSWLDKANAAKTEEEADAVLLAFGAWYCKLIAAWDYCEDDGVTPQPLTPANIAAQIVRFPDFISAVLVAVIEDRAQGNANGTTRPGPSAATSLPTANLTSSPVASSLNPSTSSSRRAGSKARRRSIG